MNLKVEDLYDESRFRLLKSLHYDEIVEFVFENIQKKNYSTRSFYFINILLFVLIIGFSISGFRNDLFIFRNYIISFLLAMIAGTFIVIPFHEILHGIAYKITGAPKIDFGADLRQGIFYVAANNYVIGRRQFTFVALTPFIAINLTAVILINFSTPYVFIGTLFFCFSITSCVLEILPCLAISSIIATKSFILLTITRKKDHIFLKKSNYYI